MSEDVVLDAEMMEEDDPIEDVKITPTKKPKMRELLTERQMKFASEVAKGSNLSDSYRRAFPDQAENKYVKIYANKLVNNPKVRQQVELLQQATRMKFIIDAPRAAQKLIELSKNAKNEKVQLDATKDILSRGGLQPPQRVETVHVGIFGSASQDDIRNLLRQQLEVKADEATKEDEKQWQ